MRIPITFSSGLTLAEYDRLRQHLRQHGIRLQPWTLRVEGPLATVQASGRMTEAEMREIVEEWRRAPCS